MDNLPVSRKKLYDQLKMRNISPAKASAEIGFDSGYLSNCASRGFMSKRGAYYLEKFFRIMPEDFAPDLFDTADQTEPETPENPRPVAEAIRPEYLEAFAQTFARAFMAEYKQTAKEAIVEALKEAGL